MAHHIVAENPTKCGCSGIAARDLNREDTRSSPVFLFLNYWVLKYEFIFKYWLISRLEEVIILKKSV